MSGGGCWEGEQMDISVEEFVELLVKELNAQVKTNPDNRSLLYNAARMLNVFNELFAMTWRDVEIAEERIRDPEVRS